VPLGAMGCTDAVYEPLDIFEHLHTYANHPVSCAAALKNIEIMKREKLVDNSQAMGKYFLEKLKGLERHPIVGEARGTGLWTAIDLTSDKKSRALFPGQSMNRIITRARAKGLIIKTMGHALEFAPPLIITKAEIDEAVRILDESIAEEEKAMGF
jgi:adenosylmethionine-8-amino-7-oxononanoate aminotransferase